VIGRNLKPAIDKPLKLKSSIILENTTKLKDLKNFESACLMNSFQWVVE
jgi:hypothetical protein